jgi:hypothetical protein
VRPEVQQGVSGQLVEGDGEAGDQHEQADPVRPGDSRAAARIGAG